MKKLEQAELEQLQKINSQFGMLKAQLGDLEIQKHLVIEQVNYVKSEFSSMEKELVEKYGENTSINLQTGEVTEKEEE